jgi:hypothetical protein
VPTRKQRRRLAKEKRHDYEFVYVDEEGNELDEAPPELEKRAERNGTKPAAGKQQPAAKRKGRKPPPQPSWQRALKRAGMLGAVIFVLFSLTSKSYATTLVIALAYTALFIPFTYFLDRYVYNRWLRQQEREAAAGKPPAKKR